MVSEDAVPSDQSWARQPFRALALKTIFLIADSGNAWPIRSGVPTTPLVGWPQAVNCHHGVNDARSIRAVGTRLIEHGPKCPLTRLSRRDLSAFL